MTDFATPADAEVIEDAITSRLIDVHVSLPGIVQSYDAALQTATIELGVRRVLETDAGAQVTETLPLLENVPVAFARTASFFVSFPLTSGDAGLVVFSEASIDQWRSKGAPSSPGDARRHSLTGGVFYPGLVPNAQALADPGIESDMAMGKVGDAQMRFRGSTVEVTSGGSDAAVDFVAMAAKVQSTLEAMLDIFSGGVPVPNDGGAALQTKWAADAAVIKAALDLASTNLKAD